MSGGSWDYAYRTIEDVSRRLMRRESHAIRKAFGELMLRCAQAMHDIEWVDSNDMGDGDEMEAIMKCISPQDLLRVTVVEAVILKGELEKLINQCEKMK